MGAVTGTGMGLLMLPDYAGADVRFGCSRNCKKEVRLYAWHNV